MKTSSRKAKGRTAQYKVRDLLLESFKGILESVDQSPYDSVPAWRYDPEKLAEQEDWEQEMSTNDKTHVYPTTYETIP